MFLHVRQEFLHACDTLIPKAERAFLAGKITFAEAKEFSARSRLANKGLVTRVDLLHTRRHEVLLRKHADIAVPHVRPDTFADELDLIPEHIAASVMDGHITLLQARFAVRDQLGAKGVHDLARANTPTLPYRTRKFRLGTEHSIHAHIVRVRPHLQKTRI